MSEPQISDRYSPNQNILERKAAEYLAAEGVAARAHQACGLKFDDGKLKHLRRKLRCGRAITRGDYASVRH